ncbi:MAG: class I SAM-dependent methyltransferase [Candidatus Diapherotrites archaeon]|nr:class I SAM-dependent methyltransferase [Candidatus Diapherotrites archaeon]
MPRRKKPSNERRELAERLLKIRSFDRRHTKSGLWLADRSLADYERVLSEEITKHISDIIARKGKAKILDIGCGTGRAIAEIGKMFRGKVKIIGLTARRLPEHKETERYVDRIKIASFELFETNERFDLIISVFGGIYYSIAQLESLRKIAQLLAPQGIAIFNIDPKYMQEIKKAIENIEQLGVEVILKPNGIIIMRRVRR